MHAMTRYAGPALAVAIGAAAPVGGDVTTVQPAQDTTLYEEDDQLSNGAGEYFFAGNSANEDARRGLVAFDLSGIPAGSMVTDVSLRLYMSRTQAPVHDIALHLATTTWGEGTSDASGQEGGGAAATAGDATWRYNSYPSTMWTTLGGDYASLASATTAVTGNGEYFWSGAQMVADVQAWVDAPATNFGWFVLGTETGQQTAKRFDSRTSSKLVQASGAHRDLHSSCEHGSLLPPGRVMHHDDVGGLHDDGRHVPRRRRALHPRTPAPSPRQPAASTTAPAWS